MAKLLRITFKGPYPDWTDINVKDEDTMIMWSQALQQQGFLVFERGWVCRDAVARMQFIDVPNGPSTVVPLKPVS